MKPTKEAGESIASFSWRLAEWMGSAEGEASEEKRLADLRALEATELRAWMDAAGAPRLAVQVVESRARDTEAVLALAASRGKEIAVLVGGTGTGKTVAACWEMMRPHVKTALFVRAPKLARWPKYDAEEMDRLLDPQLLVIDDLGMEFNDEKGSFASLFDEVVSERCENRRRTVITTNLTVAMWVERYGERVLNRARELGTLAGLGDDSMRVAP